MRMLIKLISREPRKEEMPTWGQKKRARKTCVICAARAPHTTVYGNKSKCVKYGTSAHYRFQFLNGGVLLWR